MVEQPVRLMLRHNAKVFITQYLTHLTSQWTCKDHTALQYKQRMAARHSNSRTPMCGCGLPSTQTMFQACQ